MNNKKTQFIRFNIVGVTYDERQKTIAFLKSQKGVYFELVRDKDNVYDKNAIRIIAVMKNKNVLDVGFVPRDKNKQIVEAMDNNKIAFVKRYGYVGGFDNLSHGITLDVIFEE